MQWLECTVPGGDDPEELCNALAELGVGGMSIENERISTIFWKTTAPAGTMWTKRSRRAFPACRA